MHVCVLELVLVLASPFVSRSIPLSCQTCSMFFHPISFFFLSLLACKIPNLIGQLLPRPILIGPCTVYSLEACEMPNLIGQRVFVVVFAAAVAAASLLIQL